MSTAEIEKTLKKYFLNYLADGVILKGENPIDPTTPVGPLLRVTGWGRTTKGITYELPGWAEFASQTPNDEYFIVTLGENSHVVRRSQKMEVFYQISANRIREMADEIAATLPYDEDEGLPHDDDEEEDEYDDDNQ